MSAGSSSNCTDIEQRRARIAAAGFAQRNVFSTFSCAGVGFVVQDGLAGKFNRRRNKKKQKAATHQTCCGRLFGPNPSLGNSVRIDRVSTAADARSILR
jgi:hypothetical protein